MRKPCLFLLLLLALPFAGFCQSSVFPKWVDDLGGSGDSKPTGMITDKQNNVYVSGYFSGTVDFDPSAGVKNLTSVGGYDIYVAKYKPDGTLIWAVSMGGNSLDQVNNMTVDDNGNPTIAGQFQSTNLQVGGQIFSSAGAEDIFIIHLDTNGNVLWGRSIGGFSTDRGEEVTADHQGNLIETAIFQSSFTLGGSTISSPTGAFNGLIIKYDSSGNLLWDIDLRGNEDTEVYGDAVDSNGNIVVSGSYSGSVDFDPLGAHNTLNNGSNTPFIAKYTPAGKLIWVKVINGSFVNNGSAVAIGVNDDVYITGASSSSLTFNGSTTLSPQGQDTFIAKYSSSGTFLFAKDFGGSGASSFPYQIRSDPGDNVYVTGYFSGTIDFNPDPAAIAKVSDHGQRDFYAVKLDKNGNYQWAFGGGSPSCNLTLGIEMSVDTNDDVVLAGSFCGTVDFDPSACATDNVTAQNGVSDSFIVKYLQTTITNSQITAFTLTQQVSPAVIDQVKHTIAVTVAPGTNVKSLAPIVTASNGGTLNPLSGTTHDFSSPVVYTVTSSCGSVPYTVTVTLAVAKTITICLGASNTLTGDAENPVPTGYLWQVLQGSTWISAPGVVNNKNYQTSALTNSTSASVIYQLRRQTLVGSNTVYDSFYNVTVLPAIAITNDIISPPGIVSFCTAGDPALIAGSTPAGGNGVYSYKWQSSTDNVTFADIPGATGKDYDPAALHATTWFRRTVTSGTCNAPVESNTVKITILAATANNAIIAPPVTVFCAIGDPAVITGSTPTGGTGAYAYQWQSSTDNVTFTYLAGATAKDYNPPSVNATIWFRRMVTSGACSIPIISNVVKITITPAIANNTITAPLVTAFCSSGDPSVINGNTPTGGSGVYIYQWQTSTDNVTFNDIAGATAKNYDPPLLNVSTWFRREVTSGICNVPRLSNVVNILITPKPATPVPVAANVAVCLGSTATLSVASPQPGLTYDWYDSATKTNHLFTGSTYMTPTLSAGKTYYVEATNGVCNSPSLASVKVTVTGIPAAPSVVNNPAATCNGSSVILSISNPQAGYTYNWYSGATGGSAISSGTSFTTPVLSADTIYYAEAVNVSGCGSANRTKVNITVNATPQISTQNTLVCPGSTGTLTASSTDNKAVINWYTSSTGGNVLFTGSSFTTPVLNAATTYYAEAADNTTGCISASRAAVTVQMLTQLAAPLVTVGPVTVSSVTFQWSPVPGAAGYEVSIDNGQTFAAPSSGSSGLTHSITGLQSEQSVTIIVRATGSQPCELSASSTAVTAKAVNPSGDLIYVPNAFTPNVAGKNSAVHVHSENIKNLKFYVYDQWGELLYTSTSVQNGWDGTYKGKKEPVGVYVYYLEATMNDGQNVTKKGTITLLR